MGPPSSPSSDPKWELSLTHGADNGNFFWTFEQAVSYYQFALVNYIGFHDRGMLLAGGCGDTNGPPQIGKAEHLDRAYLFGRNRYSFITRS